MAATPAVKNAVNIPAIPKVFAPDLPSSLTADPPEGVNLLTPAPPEAELEAPAETPFPVEELALPEAEPVPEAAETEAAVALPLSPDWFAPEVLAEAPAFPVDPAAAPESELEAFCEALIVPLGFI